LGASWGALFPGAWAPCWVASDPWVAFPLEGSEAGFLVAPSLENTKINEELISMNTSKQQRERER